MNESKITGTQGVISFLLLCSSSSCIMSLNGLSKQQYLATREVMGPGCAAVLSSWKLAGKHLVILMAINCSFPPILHEILIGVYVLFTLFSFCPQHTELQLLLFLFLQNAFISIISFGSLEKSASTVGQGTNAIICLLQIRK